jgi:hypothetical protein
MANGTSADDGGPGFSSRKMNELIALNRSLARTANQQLELLHRIERAFEARPRIFATRARSLRRSLPNRVRAPGHG